YLFLPLPVRLVLVLTHPLPSFFLLFFLPLPLPPRSTLFPYTTLFRSQEHPQLTDLADLVGGENGGGVAAVGPHALSHVVLARLQDRKSTSELQSPCNLVCRLLLEKKKKKQTPITVSP